MEKSPLSKDLVVYLKNVFDLDKINWAFQIRLANSLLSKYDFNQVKYAIDYYKSIGNQLTSLGFLTYKSNMKDPISLYNAEKNITGGDDSGYRNWTRIEQNSKTNYGTQYPVNLFEESNEADRD